MRSGGRDATNKPSTVKIIAERANYRCVVPGCSVPTSGPGASSEDVANTGTARHIYSAGIAGPRGAVAFPLSSLPAPTMAFGLVQHMVA